MNIVALMAALQTVMRGYYATLHAKVEGIMSVISGHIQDLDNPHRVNKDTMGLDLIENFPPATEEQAREAVSNESYMTPKRTSEQIDELVLQPLTDAFNDAANQLES